MEYKKVIVFLVILCVFGQKTYGDSRYITLSRIKRNATETCPALQPPMDGLTQEDFMLKLTESCRFDHLARPPTDRPLRVNFQIDMKHIENVGNNEFKSHMFVQISFRDTRLHFADLSPARGDILGQDSLKSKIWVPHIIIKNEKSSSLMGLDRKDVFIKITPLGDVTYSYRMTTTFYCAMDLRKFPFDHQVCTINWMSWAYNESNLELQWAKDEPYVISETLQLTEFELDKIRVEYAKTTISETSGNGFNEGYSSLIFKFRLRREAGYYFLEYFLPSIMLVIMSWVSFWIQADAAPARTTLGTATMLSLITLNGNLSRNLPKVSYVKASEIWFFGGATFIFCSLAEFAFVNVIWRRKKKVELAKPSSKYIIKGALSPRLARKDLRKSESFSSFDSRHGGSHLTVHGSSNSLNVPTINPPMTNGENPNPNPDTSPPTPTPSQQAWAEMTPQEVAIWIDRKARIFFPVMFLIYNLFYWSFVYAL
ncbi:pH-sensitive chloride channel 2-like [Anthonomus grandis grandis]|uniref:pH-sensitive chloride channel 2-like n=1 Tax=Anthonomus grandis grandis TaxID=2921223 RepID=UPI0021657216|nr:pH-sensitive chloride channel 2-like [Anthonomus grandis grandis]